MRQRACRPLLADCLEQRALLSVAVGQPVEVPRLRMVSVTEHMEGAFLSFVRNHNMNHLRQSLRGAANLVPFARIDGLGQTINRRLDQMLDDIAAGDPHAVSKANDDVLEATRDRVVARVRSGHVVVK